MAAITVPRDDDRRIQLAVWRPSGRVKRDGKSAERPCARREPYLEAGLIRAFADTSARPNRDAVGDEDGGVLCPVRLILQSDSRLNFPQS